MRINFDQLLKTLDGETMREPDPKNAALQIDITLKSICLRALTIPLQEDSTMKGEEAFKRLELARLINKGEEQEIEPDQAVLIRERAAKMFGINVSGQVYEMLK